MQHCWSTTRNIVGCNVLRPFAHTPPPCCMLLFAVGSCCSTFETSLTFEPTTDSQHFLCSVIAEAQRYNVGSVCTALLTLLGPSMRITQGLQSVTGWNLHKMHCRSQNCWELFHPFAHHCQRGRNNSQHCWLTLEKNSLIIYKNAWRQVSFFKFSE